MCSLHAAQDMGKSLLIPFSSYCFFFFWYSQERFTAPFLWPPPRHDGLGWGRRFLSIIVHLVKAGQLVSKQYHTLHVIGGLRGFFFPIHPFLCMKRLLTCAKRCDWPRREPNVPQGTPHLMSPSRLFLPCCASWLLL